MAGSRSTAVQNLSPILRTIFHRYPGSALTAFTEKATREEPDCNQAMSNAFSFEEPKLRLTRLRSETLPSLTHLSLWEWSHAR